MTDRTLDALFLLAEMDFERAPGHVYFIPGKHGGLIKIGYTAIRSRINPAGYRLRDLQEASPVQLVVRGVCPAWASTGARATPHLRRGSATRPSADLRAVVAAVGDLAALREWFDEELAASGADDVLTCEEDSVAI